MNKREQLLADIFGDGAKFALQAAALNRRRRMVRRGALLGCGATVLVASVCVAHRPAEFTKPPPVAMRTGVEIMSDAELLAQLNNKPVMILKDSHGISGVVFLDR